MTKLTPLPVRVTRKQAKPANLKRGYWLSAERPTVKRVYKGREKRGSNRKGLPVLMRSIWGARRCHDHQDRTTAVDHRPGYSLMADGHIRRDPAPDRLTKKQRRKICRGEAS